MQDQVFPHTVDRGRISFLGSAQFVERVSNPRHVSSGEARNSAKMKICTEELGMLARV
jgi:hypothetical protein